MHPRPSLRTGASALFAIATTLGALAPAPARAQGAAPAAPAPAAPAVDKAELDRRLPAAKRLITAMDAAAQFRAVLPLITKQVGDLLTQSNPKAAAEFKKIEPNLAQVAETELGSLTEGMARIYAGRFTEPELNELVAFYGSPIGRKIVVQQPLLVQESMALGQTWGQALGPKIMERTRDELKKRGITL